jgi:hypothetical protein
VTAKIAEFKAYNNACHRTQAQLGCESCELNQKVIDGMEYALEKITGAKP